MTRSVMPETVRRIITRGLGVASALCTVAVLTRDISPIPALVLLGAFLVGMALRPSPRRTAADAEEDSARRS